MQGVECRVQGSGCRVLSQIRGRMGGCVLRTLSLPPCLSVPSLSPLSLSLSLLSLSLAGCGWESGAGLSGRDLVGLARAKMSHMRQSRPDSGLGSQAKVLETFQAGPCSAADWLVYSQGLMPCRWLCKPSTLNLVWPAATVNHTRKHNHYEAVPRRARI